MSQELHPDFSARSVARLVAWVSRYPWVVLGVALVLTVAALAVAYEDLEYRTQRNDLISADKPCQQRWQKYLDAFGDDDDMVVIAEGADRERMKAALDAVADKVKQRPDQFDRVFYKVDLRHVRNRALLHLPVEQLDAIRTRLDRMEPLLGPTGPIAWRMLSVQSLLASAASTLEAQAAGRELSAADRDLLVQLPAVTSSAADTLRDPARYRNPWSLAGENSDREGEETLNETQYFFVPDGSFALFTCRPKKAADTFTPAKKANAAMRGIIAEVEPQFPGVRLGLTGLPVLETDEMDLSDRDSKRASCLAMLGVVVLYIVVYRGARNPLFTITTLVVGTVWALGWATVTVGHLNILSAAFAVMLIGMGDYGVLWVARYDAARRRGESVADAMQHTAERTGPSILTAAATTALAFFAIMLADFKAVAELGWIAGSGILLCAASCLLLMPAMLVLVERRAARKSLSYPGTGRTSSALSLEGKGGLGRPNILHFPSAWAPGLAARPRTVLAIGVVLLVACGSFAGRLTLDNNLLNLQAHGLDSVKWEHKLIEKAAGATWDSLSIARSREEALALKAKYEALPEVGRVVEIASLIPADQERKLPVVRNIHDKLVGLPETADLSSPVGSSPDAVRGLAAEVARLATRDTALSKTAAALVAAVENSPYAADRLRQFDHKLATDLATQLHQLKAVSYPAPITTDDVPPALRERYIGVNGEYLVQAFAKDSLWDYEALRRFTTATTAADPEATGKAFRTLEGLRLMRVGFEWAAAYALTAIVLVLLLDMRRLSELAFGLVPLAAGAVLTLGAMGLFSVPLNPANMIALPLIVGVGVDNGVHVLHDYRNRRRGVAYRLGAATGRGVLIKGLTTVLGLGMLSTARHEGMASLGLALTLGVTFCMVAALVWLPALLRLRDLRELNREAKTKPEPKILPMPMAPANAA